MTRNCTTHSAGLLQLLFWVVFGLIVSGCSFAPEIQTPTTVTESPESFVYEDSTGVYQAEAWWESFNDPVLNQLVDATLASNLDLVEAAARVMEARALYRVERAAYFPAVQVSADASHQDNPANSGFGAQISELTGGGEGPPLFDAPDRFAIDNYSVSLGASYELDFWGRIRNTSRAALHDYFAVEDDLAAARIAVLNQLVATYFEVVDLRRRIELNVETLNILAERVDRTQERYDRGLVTSFELYAILQDFRNTQSTLPQLERLLADAEGRLAVIIGQYAGQIDEVLGDALNPRLAMNALPAGLPSDLLTQRPDVRASALRMEAARYRIGATKAAQYPTISPSGTIGLQSSELSSLFDLSQWYVNLAANITAPIFQGGRLKANVDASEARYIQAAAGYTRTVLTAYQEAESALAAYEEERQRHGLLMDQLAEAQATADLQASRFDSGVGEYLDYLDAVRTLLNVETTLASAERDLALARLGVHRALGGSWVASPAEPTLEMTPAEVPGTQD